MKKSSTFKHARTGDEANLYSCYFTKHGYSKTKCHNLFNFQVFFFFFFFVSVQRTAQKSFRIFPQTRIMVDGAKFNSHDNGGQFQKSTFKNSCCRKNSNIFVTKLKLQVRLSMQSLQTFVGIHILWYKNLNFFEKYWGMRLKLSGTPLINVREIRRRKEI